MGRRITEKAVTSSGGGGIDFNDPFEQPCFTSYTGQYNHSSGYFTWDHNLNRHNWIHGDHNAHGMYRSDNNSYSTEFIQDQGSSQWFNTQSQPDSSTDRPNLCTYSGYLGHQTFQNTSRTGGATAWFIRSPGGDRRAYAFRDVGTLPGETHQDYAIFCQWGGTFRIGQRSPTEYFMGVNYGYMPSFDIPDGWSNQMYGGVSYNRKKNFLLFMETNDGYTYQPWLWKNCPNLRAIANSGSNFHYDKAERFSNYNMSSECSLYQNYFNQTSNRQSGSYTNSGYYDYHSGKPNNGSTEDQRRCIPVICDNERVVMFQQIPNYGAWCHRWNSPTADGNGNAQGSQKNFSGTTNYGIEQGHRYGARFTQTSDGRYIAMYSPYYYYGAGTHMTIVRVSDGKTLHSQYQTSGETMIPVPYGKSNFLMASTRNTDGGSGIRFNIFFCDWRFNNRNNNDDPDMFGGIDMSEYTYDSSMYTTSYPGIIPAIYNTAVFNEGSLKTDNAAGDFDPTEQS